MPHLAAVVALEQGPDVRDHFRVLQRCLEPLGIYPDREGCHPDKASVLLLYTFWCTLQHARCMQSWRNAVCQNSDVNEVTANPGRKRGQTLAARAHPEH